MVSGIGQHDADIRQRRLGQHAGDVFVLERSLKRAEIVEFHHRRRHGRIDGRPDISPACFGYAVLQRDEAFVHRAVIAPVENENLRAPGDVPRETNRKPVRVGGGQRELPEGQSKALLQFLSHDDRVFAGQHERNAAPGLLLQGHHSGRGRVSRHGAGIAEAQVDVAMAVDVEELGAPRLAHERREGARPFRHPVHGHAPEQRLARALKQRSRLRPVSDELLLFSLHQGLQAGALESSHGASGVWRGSVEIRVGGCL